MRTIQQWFDEYGESHQNPQNKIIHWICVPLIFFSAYGLLTSIPFGFVQDFFPNNISGYVHLGNLALVFVLLFYIRLSFKLFLGMFLYALICVWSANLIQLFFPNYDLWLISIIIFVISWIGQFIGHNIEGKKPSFFKDLQFLLIGPAWVISFLFKKLGIKL